MNLTSPPPAAPVEPDPRAPLILRWPGRLLAAVGIINLLFSAYSLGHRALGWPVPYFGVDRGPIPVEPLDRQTALTILASVVVGVLTTWGGLNTVRQRGYGVAFVGALASMMPLSPTCCLGMPVGLWVLLALNRPAIRAAFRA